MNYLITGANRGLGLELTRTLLLQGHSVVAWSRRESTDLIRLKGTSPDRLTISYVDVRFPEQIKEASELVPGPIDILINNAGILLDRTLALSDLSIEQLQETFLVNATAPLLVTQSLLPKLLGSTSPVILNISSHMGSISHARGGMPYAYRMSKAALNMFTKNFAEEFPKIKSLCTHPGWMLTKMGGENAPMTTKDSCTALLTILDNHQKYPSGSFVNYKGGLIEW